MYCRELFSYRIYCYLFGEVFFPKVHVFVVLFRLLLIALGLTATHRIMLFS